MNDFKFNLLVSNVKSEDYQVVEGLLSSPFELTWPETGQRFSDVYHKIRDRLKPEFVHLFELSILSSIFLKNRPLSCEMKDWIKTHLNHTDLISGLTLEEALKGYWRAVPVIYVDGENAGVRYYLIGAFDNMSPPHIVFPEWFEDSMNIESKNAILDGIKAAEKSTGRSAVFYIYSLRMPGKKTIQGRSLAFPIGLGARSVLMREPLYQKCLATGDINFEKGKIKIQEVNGIQTKIKQARKITNSLFLYPAGNGHIGNDLKNLYAKSVGTYENGWMWAALFSPSRLEDLRKLELSLSSKENFVSICDSLKPDLFKWATNNHHVQTYLEEIKNAPDSILLNALTMKLEDYSRNAKGNYDRVAQLSSLYDDPNDIEAMAKINPEAALIWCSTHLSLANHAGNTALSNQWIKTGFGFQESVQKTSKGQQLYLTFINRASGVSERQNSYVFEPDLPDIFLNALKKQKELNAFLGDPSDETLGALCGTVAQNFALCGPEYFQKTKEYIELALKA